MLSPRPVKFQLLGLGSSVAGDITAEVIVVSNFDELKENADKVKDKIVLYNAPFTTYGATVQYRTRGASEAAKFGALASLVRSVTPYSLYTPHTGGQTYEEGVVKIPTAAITVEDAEMMARMYKRGQKVVVHLKMSGRMGPPVSSFNILIDLPSNVTQNEIVVIGGHSDSWDVGQGASDDGSGFFSAINALLVINKLIKEGKLVQPRRLIRAVLWVDEEVTQRGAATYYEDHKNIMKEHVIAIESDIGNFHPTTIGFTGLPEAMEIIKVICEVLMAPFGVGTAVVGGVTADNAPLCAVGVPCGSLSGLASKAPDYFYFDFHHSPADSITHINRNGMRNSAAALGVLSYVLAEMENRLPSAANK